MRIGYFNINGVRDQNKRVKLSEFMKIWRIDIMLQETHCYRSNRVGLMVGGKICTQSWF